MNKGQRFVCIGALFLCAALTVWPPWMEKRQFSALGWEVTAYVSTYRRMVWTPSEIGTVQQTLTFDLTDESTYCVYHTMIDTHRLFLEWAVVAFLAAGVIAVLHWPAAAPQTGAGQKD